MSKKSRIADWAAFTVPVRNDVHACNCIGPQNGDPVCPCQMRNVQIREGRYVTVIDHGPAPLNTGTKGLSE